uniref:TNF receptor superfamily member 4 n=1 Tax=Homo sapiens TaxID=9606 RepID=A0A8V8TPH7_HUMAN
MCVGARRLGRGPCAALLLLGLGLSTVTGLHCVGDTYPSNDRCCHECRPGNGMEVGVSGSSCARPHRTQSAAAGRAPSPWTATSLELTVPPALQGTSPQATTRPASPGPTAPWLGSTPCSRPAIARTQSVRTGTPQPRSPRRPRAPRPGPSLSSPLKPGPEPHRDPPPGPWRSPGAVRLPPSWAWAWCWGCWAPWPSCWPCTCSGGTRGCPPMPTSPLGEAVSGPPSKRSRPTPTPPWPRSDLGPPRWTLGPARLEPGGSAGRAGQVQAACPATLLGQLCTVLGADGCLRLSAYVCHAYLLPRGTTIKTLAD